MARARICVCVEVIVVSVIWWCGENTGGGSVGGTFDGRGVTNDTLCVNGK